MPMIHFLTVAEKDSTKTFFSSESYINWKKMPFKDLKLVFLSLDTPCQGIDPMPNTLRLQVIENRLDKTEIKELKLIQEWFWDDSRQKLSIRFVAVAPIKFVLNEAGEFLYRQPLFYRRTDTD